MKRFLVTGGAGFIGSHIVEYLVKRGYFVRVLDNFSTGKKENLKEVLNKIELVQGDIRSLETCFKVTRGIDFVLHQAALRSVPKSLEIPEVYNEVNIQGTLNLLKASLRNRIKRFVFASSSSVYGQVKRFPEKEDFLPSPFSPYGLTKLTGEYYCQIYQKQFGLSTVSLRYFNVFGPRQAIDDEYAVVIPKFISCLLRDQSPPIYGTGKQSRDFTYVSNVVEANFLAATKRSLTKNIFNIASGKSYTILELLKILKKITKKQIDPVFLPVRAGDVFKTHADISQAKRLLGFKPKIDFMEGLRLTVQYFQENV
ncbi:MAG: SDR family oxidoreductase [Candidatus Omnitrophica bacterium]|nr:SDR family oxidoreductase [Candidatus Omnitrophota bacterium]